MEPLSRSTNLSFDTGSMRSTSPMSMRSVPASLTMVNCPAAALSVPV
jgi:hypothetical protein